VKVLVTGGGGFLGGALVRRLLARGDDVTALQRGSYLWLEALGVRTVRGDLANTAAVAEAVRGADVVFHVAAKAGVAGRPAEYRAANVIGTRNVITACLAAGVPRLVHTSTPAVVHAGEDLSGADERLPYADRFRAPYPATKAIAERDVLASDSSALATVALRPHLIWGPGDPQLTGRILERGRRGRLRFVGDGSALIDTTYLDNAVDAHLLAADALARGTAGGRAYFISQGDPRPIAELTNAILAAGGLPPVTKTVPYPVAWTAGAVAEVAYRLLRPAADPPMTRFLAEQLATSHWFDISAARRDLGYTPAVSIEEGLRRLAEFLAGGNPSTRPAPSPDPAPGRPAAQSAPPPAQSAPPAAQSAPIMLDRTSRSPE
jgi:nucleoside-diphosphate-sugar epimerase